MSIPDIHPLASLIPEMSESEYRELCDDVAAHGLRQPIVIYEGLVLDGRHRARACEETGAVPRFEEYAGDEPAAHVLSLNLHRRHLSVSQRSMIATDFLPHLEAEARARQVEAGKAHGRGTDSSASFDAELSAPSRPDRASDRAARAVGVGAPTVQRAKRVAQEAPDLVAAVRSGELTVNAAHDLVLERKRSEPKPETRTAGAPRPAAVMRLASQAADLALPLTAINLPRSCAQLSEAERTKAIEKCAAGHSAITKLKAALKAASERENS